MMTRDDARPCAPAKPNDRGDENVIPALQILSIDNVAETFGVSRWTLWVCELRGLIRRRRRAGNIQVYSWDDCDRIAFIIKCRRAGLRLSEVAPILCAINHSSALYQESGQELCLALAQKLEDRRRAINEALSELEHIHSMLGVRMNGDFESVADAPR